MKRKSIDPVKILEAVRERARRKSLAYEQMLTALELVLERVANAGDNVPVLETVQDAIRAGELYRKAV